MEQNSKIKLPKNTILKSTQLFIIASTILVTLVITLFCIGILMRYEVETDVSSVNNVLYWNDKLTKEQMIWYKKGIDELWNTISLRTNRRRAQNVIVFMATGLSSEILAAARLNNLSSTTEMSWDKFPFLGMLKHSCRDSDYCNSLSFATALFGGVRTNAQIGGLDSSVPLRDCSAALNETHKIESILLMAQKAGKRTGFITTGRVTAPPVAALYANVADSTWECDQYMPRGKVLEGCSDIASELVENSTGRNINVIMGGGRQTLVSNVPSTESDPIDTKACNSDDKRNLIRDWRTQKLLDKKSFIFLQNAEELQMLNGSNTDYVLGVYSNGNLQRNRTGTPSLDDMVTKSISVLKRQKQGYLLVVNEKVDPTTERKSQMQILRNFNEVIRKTRENAKRNGERTLFVVLFNGGIPRRNTEITSAEIEKKFDIKDYVIHEELPSHVLQSFKSDTLVFAQGPQSYLFQGIHDEIYLAHAISFSMQMGPYYRKKLREETKN